MTPRLLVTHDWKLYLGGRRIHHGLTGICMTATGIALLLHDLKDRPWRFTP